MPCYDGRDSYAENRLYGLEKKAANNEELNKFLYECDLESSKLSDLVDITKILIKRKDLLAKLLCFVMNGLNKHSQDFLCQKNIDLKEWWEEHQRFDKERTN